MRKIREKEVAITVRTPFRFCTRWVAHPFVSFIECAEVAHC